MPRPTRGGGSRQDDLVGSGAEVFQQSATRGRSRRVGPSPGVDAFVSTCRLTRRPSPPARSAACRGWSMWVCETGRLRDRSLLGGHVWQRDAPATGESRAVAGVACDLMRRSEAGVGSRERCMMTLTSVFARSALFARCMRISNQPACPLGPSRVDHGTEHDQRQRYEEVRDDRSHARPTCLGRWPARQ
jgi:hypothetical protein